METSYKCHLNGTKKRKRKPRKNTTKYGENAKIPTKRARKGEKSQATATAESTAAFNDQEMAPPSPNVCNEEELAAPAPNALSSPTRLTREQIIQNSPVRVTRGRLQTLLGEGVDPILVASPKKTVQKRSPPKKQKPRRLKTN